MTWCAKLNFIHSIAELSRISTFCFIVLDINNDTFFFFLNLVTPCFSEGEIPSRNGIINNLYKEITRTT